MRFALLASLTLLACHSHSATADGGDGSPPAIASVETVEGPSASANTAPPPKDAPHVWATALIAPIFSAMDWPPKDPDKAEPSRKQVVRVGYFRDGENVPVKLPKIVKPNCKEGWYELAEGGFVCGQFVTDAQTPEMLRPPLTDGPLPYEYALNLVNGAPLYRRVPTHHEREDAERHLMVGRSRDGDLARAQQGAIEDDGGVPWYLQDHHGGRPQVTLDDIRSNTGLVSLRMVKGFYLAIDGDAPNRKGGGSGKLWRTTGLGIVAHEHVLIHKAATEFKGVDLRDAAETRKLPLAWVLNPKAWKYTMDDNEKKSHRKEHVDRFTIVQLTGKTATIDNRVYRETKDGYWLKDVEHTITKPGPPPKDLGPNEKWIDVNITTQSLVAFEGAKPIYATIISSGRHNNDDPNKDHRTKTGEFRIREKHIAATMDDDSASDGPYSIQDVPWIMYFHGGIALHGAFWHSSFGHERSHGCVNLEPYDAKNLFGWVGPRLPDGWHGIHATDANPGTRVIVHE